MKTRILSCTIAILSLSIIFTACQKGAFDTTTTDYTAESAAHSEDDSRFSSEVDAVANDANSVLELTSGFTGRADRLQSIICDADVTIDTTVNPRTITITYNGNNCLGNRTRTGVIVISMGQNVRWKNAGAALNVSFQNFKITRVIDNKSITINGTQTYTNVTGGLLFNLASVGTITHSITSNNMSVTFDNGALRTWKVARQRSFTYNNGIVITVTGTHTEGALAGVAEWGTNRFGNTFTTAITQPLVVRQDCSFRIGSGKVEHATSVFNASATFGLNATGNAATCPGLGFYYMKIEWTGPAGVTHATILPY